MKEVKVYLSDELDKRFRRVAMETHGYGRGSLSKAAEEALAEWCRLRERPAPVGQASTASTERADQQKKVADKQELPPQDVVSEVDTQGDKVASPSSGG